MSCGFSKFVLIIQLKSKKAEHIARKLWKRVFSILGIPSWLHSDQGPEFVNEVLGALCKFLAIKQTFTTAYHPQGNAYAERIHKFINAALAQHVNVYQNDWDDFISCLQVAANDCASKATGIAPAEVILGRHLNLPGFELVEDVNDNYHPKSYANKLKWILAKTQEIVQGKMAIKEARNTCLSANIDTTKFYVNQAVRLWQPTVAKGKKAKLTQKWFGPYFIRDIKNEGRVIYLNKAEIPSGIMLQAPKLTKVKPPKAAKVLLHTPPVMCKRKPLLKNRSVMYVQG